jgi:asparagine N-glycosylation enzyme membrane subunit Stt3
VLDKLRAQLTRTNAVFLVLVVVAVLFAIQYRTTMLGFYGFYEPDGFYYFTAMRAIVNNGFQFPQVLGISGWPPHHAVAENHGLYYVTLIPYVLLGESVSYYTIMRLVPVLFGLLDMFGAYMLSRYISKDKIFGFFVILFVGLSMGNAARTSALVYRGDSFVLFFAIAAMVFFMEVLRQDDPKKKTIMSVAAAVSLLLANFVWSGGTVALVIFFLSFLILLSYAFIFRREKLVDGCKYLLIAPIVWFVLVNVAHATGSIDASTFSGLYFVPVYLSLALFWALTYITSTMSIDFMRTPIYRFFILLLIVVAGVLVFAFLQPETIQALFVSNGFVIQSGSFGSTTEELQSPTCQFLYTSFGVNLFTAIPNLFIALSTMAGDFQCSSASQGTFQSIWTNSFGEEGVILLILLFIPYFFMQVYDSQGLLGGKPRLKFDATPGMLVLMSFFIVMAYLEMHVIRYNSLLSVPLAMTSAFTIYWLILAANNLKIAYPYARFISLAVLGIAFFYVFYQLVYYANMYSSTLSQADSINPQFISAMQWLKANSPANSVVITLWPDGSVVEAVANRTSVMDSVGSESGPLAPFAAWLLNTSPDPQFLSSPQVGSPNYIVERTTWLIETQGVYTEANISANVSLYGYAPLTSFSESAVNSTYRQIVLRTSPGSQYPDILIGMRYSNTTGRLDGLFGTLQVSQGQNVPFQQVVVSDQNSGNFSMVTQGLPNQTNGELLMLQYSEINRTGFFLNLTGAYVFAGDIANSNMLKLLYMCNTYNCVWNNNRATMQLVYMNSDTRILKINYNTTG